MKKFFVFTALIALAMLIVSSCDMFSKLSTRFEHFVDRVEKKADNCSASQWQEFNEDFSKLMDEYHEKYNDLSRDEITKINKQIGRYTGLALKHGANSFMDAFKNGLSGLGALLGGLGDDEDDDIEDLDDHFSESLKELGENFGDKMEELGENFGDKMEELGENFGDKMEELGENLGNKMEGLVEGLSL